MCANRRNLAERIQYAMLQKGMHQSDLVRKTGLSRAVVSQIVSGSTKNPTFEKITRIALALDVSLDYLAGNAPYINRK